jgi:uroporphyrin-III C-methyltransferase
MTVYLVGAGPGDSDLLTLRAARLLQQADVVVFDALVEPEVLEMVSAHAELIDVGKRPGFPVAQENINALLVALGKDASRCIVRLKGGDPYLFGRGGEEACALMEAGVACEVVPGVSSAFSAPAAAGIPVTHRGVAAAVTVVTGHRRNGEPPVDWAALANAGSTLVVLMGMAERASIAQMLIDGGLLSDTPVAIVERGTRLDQHVARGELHELKDLPGAAPAVIVIGAVAAIEVATFSPTSSADPQADKPMELLC